ncbi:hypothetical protein, conserved [Plasmodium gonderi]|uniref:Uncharacterized protein n=1 Tax=Plasmodium gonderi TaxID=77519 RepID=A0A1Y1JQP3_PLAGO|nr:hypothetical protein, conserved [Plasmodium gonderi]GAW82783.1 hypothetical protein, conserved [Plasmodium gonderi]
MSSKCSEEENSNEGTREKEKKKKKKKGKTHIYYVINKGNYSQEERQKEASSTEKLIKKKYENSRVKVHVEDFHTLRTVKRDASKDQDDTKSKRDEESHIELCEYLEARSRHIEYLMKKKRQKMRTTNTNNGDDNNNSSSNSDNNNNSRINSNNNNNSRINSNNNNNSRRNIIQPPDDVDMEFLLMYRRGRDKDTTTDPASTSTSKQNYSSSKNRKKIFFLNKDHIPQTSTSTPSNLTYNQRLNEEVRSSYHAGGETEGTEITHSEAIHLYNMNTCEAQNQNNSDAQSSNSNSNESSSINPQNSSSTESNIFSKLFYRIRKAIIDRRGNPITNENIIDNDMCELTIVNTNMNEVNNGNNILQIAEDNETVTLPRHSDNQIGRGGIDGGGVSNCHRNRNNDIICLNGLNPNDLLNSSVIINPDNIEMNEMFSNVENGIIMMGRTDSTPIGNASNEDVIDHNTTRSNNDSRTIHLDYRNIPHKIATYFKDNISYVKEKIKNYWMERVREANTQLTSPHQNTSERERQRERENDLHNEDENDDPSCLQVLFFLGLVCKFPILWIIGSIIFCITPNEHKKTKMWSLINTFFALISVIYFISTSKFKIPKPLFMVLMEPDNGEKNNLIARGILKNSKNITQSLAVFDESSSFEWIGSSTHSVFTTGRDSFLNWNFVSTQKPDSHVLLSSNAYKLLNRVQVTFIFGRGNKYPTEQIKKIKTFFQNIKENMNIIPYETITLTEKDIPEDFYGGGLICNRGENNLLGSVDKKINEKEMENAKWYLFWKEDDYSNDNKRNDFDDSHSSYPIGEVFFFKNEHICRVAFLYPKKINFSEKNMPENFVQINKIIIKPF